MHSSFRETGESAPERSAQRESNLPAVASADIEANRFEMVNRLAEDLAHEVKNPLNAVVINLELLKRRIVDGQSENALDRVDRVGQEVRRVHTLVDALFQVMRPEREPNSPVVMDQVLDDLVPLVELQARLARLELDCRLAGEGALIELHPHALKQAVLNLVVNALDAAEGGGGRLALRTERTEEEARVHLHASSSDRSDRARDRLAVVRALVEGAGGRMEIRERGPDGTEARVLLTLPRVGKT